MGGKKKKLSLKLSDWGSVPNTPEFAKAQREFLGELFFRDRIVPTWKNLGEMASRIYNDPQDALDVLTKNADKTLKATDLKRFYLTEFIEDQLNKKINKGKGPRTIVVENLEICCKLHGVPFDQVGPSKTEINKNPKLRDKGFAYLHNQIVEQIVEKRRRVLDGKKSEYNRWRREEYRKKEFTAFLAKSIPKKKK